MRPAFVVCDGVNLVDDYGLHVAQQFATLLRRQQDVERLGRGDQDVRRRLQHPLPVGSRRVAGTHEGPNLRHQKAAFPGELGDLRQRALEVLLDVVAECL